MTRECGHGRGSCYTAMAGRMAGRTVASLAGPVKENVPLIMRINNLQTRVLVALILISVLPALAMALQGYHCGRQAVTETMYRHVTAVTEGRVVLITSWLDERIEDMRDLASLPTLVDALQSDTVQTAELERVLSSQETRGRSYEGLALYDSAWKAMAVTHSGKHLQRCIPDEALRRGVEEGDGVYMEAAHSHGKGGIGVHAGVRVVDGAGKTLGYLTVNINMTNSLMPLLQNRSGLMNTGKSFVINKNLDLISEPFPDRPGVAFRRKANAFLGECAWGGAPRVGTYADYNGNRVVGTARALPHGDWAVVVEIDAKEAMGWINRLLFRAGLTLLIVLVCALFLSIWLSRLLGRPLAKLARTAHSISEGNPEERLGPLGLAEAEEVRRAFNHMLDELQEKERELVRTATLATVGEITSSVVHEIRNPLSSVKMNLQSLAPLCSGSPENEELAQIALGQIQRLEVMLNELLQYGRPLELHLEAMPFAVVMEEAHELSRDIMEARNINLSVEDGLNGEKVRIDIDLFSRALANLLRNAAEVTPEGGTIHVAARPLKSVPDRIEISVSDDGPGIWPENLERLFRPFFTTKPDGTGLGLANVRKIVTLHGGDVTVSNGESKGAVFILRFPRHRNESGTVIAL